MSRTRSPFFFVVPLLFTTLLSGMVTIPVQAADVYAQLSTRETYVGEPLTLQIVIENASDFSPPTLPAVSGLEISSQGAPQRHRQRTNINGRISQTSSTILAYSVTPSRPGEFEIPSLQVTADGKKFSTSPLRLVAATSETGDLLFVEIDGKQDRVYVGQPLELTLKIWLRPFRDRKNRITLDASNMWSTLSPRSSWGSFAAQLNELANNRKHPRSSEVLREDHEGNMRNYYLYEIDATIYPKRPGKIDASDVRIIVDYPVQLGRSRDPMEAFLGGSLFSRFEDDDRFGSFFGSQLQITKTRPIQAEAAVDSTQVVPIPTQGRPASYQGAVGNYTMTARTDTQLVHAGDPLTLQIEIQGDGPLDLIQAPPLQTLNKNFRVDQQPLAGFVQDDSKYFTTTVRPRDTSVTEIPSIEMSFFDPVTEAFQTIKTAPIPIEVRESETLHLDAIAGNRRSDTPVVDQPQSDQDASNRFSLSRWWYQNDSDPSVLQMQTQPALLLLAGFLLVTPPIILLALWLIAHRGELTSPARLFRSPKRRAMMDLNGTQSSVEVTEVLHDYLTGLRGTGGSAEHSTWLDNLGFLRARGQSPLAAELETLLHQCKRDAISHASAVQRAGQWIERADSIRKSGWRSDASAERRPARKTSGAVTVGPTAGLILAALLFPGGARGADTNQSGEAPPAIAAANSLSLDAAQQAALLGQAGESYAEALRSEHEVAKELFQQSAEKYQQIIDSGIRSSGLFLSLGNARFQAGDIGGAIASYRRAQRLEPLNLSTQINLVVAQLHAGVPIMQYRLPLVWVILVGVGSVLGWSLLGLSVTRRRRTLHGRALRHWGLACLLLAGLGTAMLARETLLLPEHQAVAVVDQLELRAGDGEEFETTRTIHGIQGYVFELGTIRAQWVQLMQKDQELGWVSVNQVELI